MKKAVVLGMILLAIGGMAFADGVTVGMDFGRTQFNVASGNSANSTTNEGWVGPTGQFPTGQRIDMQFAWSNDHTAINITDYVTNGGSAADTIVNAYGTLKFIPDMFTMYIGEFNGDGWDHFRLDTAHPIHDVNNNNVGRFGGWGAILDLMPKDSGFEAALFAKLADPSVTPIQTLTGATSQYGFAASYTVPNLVKVQAGSTTFGLYPSPQRNIFASVQIFMVPNLTAWDNFYYAGFDQTKSVTIYSDLLALSYDMKPLTLILAASFGGNSNGDIVANKGVASPMAPDYARGWNAGSDYTVWAVMPEAIYNMGAISLGLYANIWGLSVSNSGINFQIEPYVKLNDFGLRASFLYAGSTASGATNTWEIPVLIDWGF